MTPDLSWTLDPGVLISVAIVGGAYLARWRQVRKGPSPRRRSEAPAWRLWCLLASLLAAVIALVSPLDALADQLFFMHMVQHMLLLDLVPILAILSLTKVILRPITRALRDLEGRVGVLAHPAFAVVAYVAVIWGWHVPAAYDLALENETVHGVEHLCFLGTSLLFWWTIFRPWPARLHPADWGALLYLALSDIVMTMLSGFLTFCDRPVYPFYVAHPNPFGLPVLEDQVLGAVIMWVLGSFAFLVPAMVLTVRLLSPNSMRSNQRTTTD
jgi:cytochrome c oxidase assembly factor CtaG